MEEDHMMKKPIRQFRALFNGILLLAVFDALSSCGCASTSSGPAVTSEPPSMAFVDPSFRVRQGDIRRVAVLPPRFTVYKLTAGNRPEPDEAWSNSAQEGVAMALQEELESRAIPEVTQIREEDLGSEQKDILAYVQSRFGHVNGYLRANYYEVSRNSTATTDERPSEAENSAYGLGAQVKEISGQADALLVVRGVDARSGSERKALQGGLLLMGAAVGALTGYVPIYTLGTVQTTLSMALFDARTGAILWHRQIPNSIEGQQFSDIRERDGAKEAVKQLFAKFPYQEKAGSQVSQGSSDGK